MSQYQSLDQKSWSMTKLALISAACGVIVGAVAYTVSAPDTSLYASTVTATRPLTRSVAAPAVVRGQSQFARYAGAQQGLQVEEVESIVSQPQVAFQAPQAQSALSSLNLLLVPLAAVAGWLLKGRTQKNEEWAMAASAAELRSRLTTVKNSKKITDAMKLVASAKLRRAQQAVIESRPFSESLQGVFGDVIRRVEGTEAGESPLLKIRDVKNITLIIVGGDRGLCGGYNNMLIKRSSIRFDELKAAGYNVNCITIGRKVTNWYKRRADKYPSIGSYECGNCVPQVPKICEGLVNSYITGETDTVELLYTNFVSLVKTNPGTRSLLPFKPTEATNMEVDEVCRLTTKDGKLAVECEPGEQPPNLLESDVVFEQSPEEILDTLIPLYLNSQLVRTLQESIASELSARMTSMQNASDNAKELGKTLNLQYNRIRQASVTSQLLEITAGAAAAN